MKRNSFFKTLSIGIICCTILLSCQKQENIKNNTDLSTNKTEVSLKLVKEISNQFSFNDKIIGSSKQMRSQSCGTNIKEEKKIKNIEVIKDNYNEPAAYIVNYEPSGFVIISGTKKEEPILAYSSESTFNSNELSQGVANWIDKRLNKIEQLKNSSSDNIPLAIQKEWETYSDYKGRHGRGHENDELDYTRLKEPDDDDNGGGGFNYEDHFFKTISEIKTVGPLLTSIWGQGDGYNESLPLNNKGERADVGCVATAAAQVMNYYKWPETYNWNIFSNIMYKSSNHEAKLEVSKLMRDIGESIGMKYSTDGSGAKTEKLVNALAKRFKYSNEIKYVNYNYSTVISEISARRPVIMDGYRTKIYHGTRWLGTRHAIYKNGHAWVCDGYKATYSWNIDTRKAIEGQKTKNKASISSYFLHMNWGWNGRGMSKSNNGWYKCDDFTVKLFDGKTYNYKYKQRCIVNIKPNK